MYIKGTEIQVAYLGKRSNNILSRCSNCSQTTNKLFLGDHLDFFLPRETTLATVTCSLTPKMQNIQVVYFKGAFPPTRRVREHRIITDWQNFRSITHLSNAKCCQDFLGLQFSVLLVLNIFYLLMAAFHSGSSLCLVSFSW